MRHCALLLFALVACAKEPTPARHDRTASSAHDTASSGPQPVLVELFTSEGCSSCPSAESAVHELVQTPPDGARVIALEFHVDYWNGLGHVDPFSRAAFTSRQQAYAQQFHGRGMYTPQAVVEGRREMVGSRARELAESVTEAAQRAHAAVTFVDGGVQVGALPDSMQDARVMLADVNREASTRVTGGENAGRTLHHNWVVTQLRDLGAVKAAGGLVSAPPARIPRVAFVVSGGAIVGSAAWPE